MTPTRAQRKTWRRRVSRAKHTRNPYRHVTRGWIAPGVQTTGIIASSGDLTIRERWTIAPWLRDRSGA